MQVFTSIIRGEDLEAEYRVDTEGKERLMQNGSSFTRSRVFNKCQINRIKLVSMVRGMPI